MHNSTRPHPFSYHIKDLGYANERNKALAIATRSDQRAKLKARGFRKVYFGALQQILGHRPMADIRAFGETGNVYELTNTGHWHVKLSALRIEDFRPVPASERTKGFASNAFYERDYWRR